MSIATSFTCFADLPLELRMAIWNCAIASFVRDAVEKLGPHSMAKPDGARYYWDVDDSEDMADCLPIMASCREARQLAIDYFRPPAVRKRCLSYIPPRILAGRKHRGADALPILLRVPEDERDPFPPATTLHIAKGRFNSAEHLVDVVSRYFGNAIERIVFDWVLPYGGIAQKAALSPWAYWNPGGGVTQSDFYKILDGCEAEIVEEEEEARARRASRGGPGAWREISISEDGKIHLWGGNRDQDELVMHMVRMRELFGASRQRLPQLKDVEVNCEIVRRPRGGRPFDPEWDDNWVKLKCVVEGDQVFGWFTEYDM